MRRIRIPVLLLALASLILVPGTPQALADDIGHVKRIDALITGQTLARSPGEGLSPTRRTSGEGWFGGFDIPVVIDCTTAGGDEEVVTGILEQAPGQMVVFDSDDDITDGYGRIRPTDDGGAFRSTGTGIRPTGAFVARIEIRIEEHGRFHRLGNVVRVDLTLDVRVMDHMGTPNENDDVTVCHVRRIEFWAELLIVAAVPNTQHGNRLEFFLAGPGFGGDGSEPQHRDPLEPLGDRWPCSSISPDGQGIHLPNHVPHIEPVPHIEHIEPIEHNRYCSTDGPT